MKRTTIIAFLFFITLNSFANRKDSVIYYQLPDSIKAISFMVDFSVGPTNTKKEVNAGIGTDVVKLLLNSEKNKKEVEFDFPAGSEIVATGIGVKSEKNEITWQYNWQADQKYKLLIATAGDSTGNFALYSGYIFLPEEKKWKLIGTCKINGQWNSLKQPSMFSSKPKKTLLVMNVQGVWVQRNNGSWKNLVSTEPTPPVVNLLSHVDSLEQLTIEKRTLDKLLSSNSPIKYKEGGGVYFAITKEGTGKQVSINDTVVVHYKGYLFDNNSVFDETKDKPATFPLKRLITGWQIALPFCKVGGKVQVIIPSNLAYSIRTRTAKIPPNSILVFEIEVVDTKSPQ